MAKIRAPLRRILGLAILLAIYLVIVFLIPRPDGIRPESWRLLGIFAAAIAGLILQPIPGGAVVLVAITLVSISGAMTIGQALAGYADPTVWLVIAAFIISRGLLNTGLARRIALMFVRAFGRSSAGISYSLALSDMVLATIIPSNGARSGGVILPIARSIAQLYGSEPGPTAGLLGAFLLTSVYQSICVTAAMFYTGQASNLLAARIATDAGYPVTWTGWFVAGLVPGLCSLAVVPWVVMKLNPPSIRHTPEAAAFAHRELQQMGPMSRQEIVLAIIFAGVCLSWITTSIHHVDITVTALLGSCALLLTGVISWEDVKAERSAWDIFIWYGGLLRLGKALNDAGITTEFAHRIGALIPVSGWFALLVLTLLIYFYVHYGFASITAHILAMYPPFLVLLFSRHAPMGLVVYAFACFSNLAAGLTHYGTTPAPMFFAYEYVPLGTWWKVGFVMSVVNIAIWFTAGFAWWKLIGLW